MHQIPTMCPNRVFLICSVLQQRRPSCSNLEPARAGLLELGQLGLALRISGKELQFGSARISSELLGFIYLFLIEAENNNKKNNKVRKNKGSSHFISTILFTFKQCHILVQLLQTFCMTFFLQTRTSSFLQIFVIFYIHCFLLFLC